MFVQDFQVLDVPFEEVAGYVDAHAQTLVDSAFEGARIDGERLRTRVGPSRWPSLFSKTVEVSLAPLRLRGDSFVMSFRWSSVGGAALFPILEGELDLAPLGDSQTVLQVHGQYDPPAGSLGRHLDRLVLHRVAEATVRAFLTRACSAISDATGYAPQGPS
jgi:hypothetical protein